MFLHMAALHNLELLRDGVGPGEAGQPRDIARR